MPIKFRCLHCRQFLGISPARAGELTDCPTCGRTVRVPNLDGTVTPLPAAQLDLRDSQLAEALSALSQIGRSDDGGSESLATAVMTPPAVTRTARNPAPVVIAEPVEPAASEPVIPVSPARDQSAVEVAAPPLLDLDLAAAQPVPLVSRRRSKPSPELKIAAIALAAISIFVAGFLTGRAGRSTNASAASSDGRDAQQLAEAQVAAAAQPASLPPPKDGIYGAITYRTANGPARPDGGARVIALPVERPDGNPLETSGFRAGAVPTDRERAAESVRTIGGDFVVADANGNFALQLAPGQYELLFFSRHHPRDPAEPLPPETDTLLSAHFDQPAGLIGSLAIERRLVECGSGAVPLNLEFSK